MNGDYDTMNTSPITKASNIERTVMRRVRIIRILALFFSMAVFAVLAFIAALWGIGREVWVARVFENMPRVSDLGAFTSFWFLAFQSTRLVVQAFIILSLVSLVLLARELVRAVCSRYLSRNNQ